MNDTTAKGSAIRANRRRGYSLIELTMVCSSALALATIGLPQLLTVTQAIQTASDARLMANELSLVRMQAAASFTKVRLYVDTSAKTYHMELWQKSSSSWVPQGGTFNLSPGVTMGYGNLNTPPPSTQSSIAQAPACTDNSGNTIANTVCVVANSHSSPIDSTGSPTGSDALYVTGGGAVFSVTISAMGTIQTWRSPASNAVWTKL